MSATARLVLAWLDRVGGTLPREALFEALVLHGRVSPEDFQAALAELAACGAVRQTRPEPALELVE